MSDTGTPAIVPDETEYRDALARIRARAWERLSSQPRRTGGTLPPAERTPEDDRDREIVRRFGAARGVLVDDRPVR